MSTFTRSRVLSGCEAVLCCVLVEYQSFTLKMKVAWTYETSESYHSTTRHHNWEDIDLKNHSRKKLRIFIFKPCIGNKIHRYSLRCRNPNGLHHGPHIQVSSSISIYSALHSISVYTPTLYQTTSKEKKTSSCKVCLL